jgi:ATP synthase F1 epsilon subunit
MRLSVTTPRGALVDADVDEVVAPGALGEFGVLSGHVPLMSALKPGVLVYRAKDARAGLVAIGPGFLQVAAPAQNDTAHDRVLVLVDQALAAGDIDRAQAQKDLAAADKELDTDKLRFFVTCPRGTEGALRRELVGLRIGSPKGDRGGVWFDGPLPMAMGVCLHARTAVRVLLRLAEFEVRDARALYAAARAVDWRAWLTARSTLAVDANVKDNAVLTHSGFAALKVKDAVVDSLRDALGARPDVDPKRPDVAIVLHVAGGQGALFLDLAGDPLHRRGYRVAMTEAPLKETLAAAVLALGGVALDAPFVDPMAGGGTLAIEHAIAARGLPPGLRRRFGFESWPTLDESLRAAWARTRAEAEDAAMAPRLPLPPIVCADVSSDALGAARRNASAAGVDEDLTFELADAAALERRWDAGTVCTNPPYGERLRPRDLETLYRDLGHAFMRLSGWAVVVLSGSSLLARALPLKAAISHRLFNGPLEVRLLRYEIPKAKPASGPR